MSFQWFRSAIPSNSLAAVYGIAKELADERVLGEDNRHRYSRSFDETKHSACGSTGSRP